MPDPEATPEELARAVMVNAIRSVAEGRVCRGRGMLDFEAQKAFRKGAQASQVIDYFAANFGGKGL